MKKEIPRASDSLSRKPKGFWAATFLLELFGVSCQEKEDPGNSGRKCEHINGRNDRFPARCDIRPVAIPEIFAQTQGFYYWQLIHKSPPLQRVSSVNTSTFVEMSLLRKKLSVLRGNESPPLKWASSVEISLLRKNEPP